MITLGVVGGIGSGKTFVTDLFCELDSTYKISTDDLLHELIEHPDIQAQLRNRWKLCGMISNMGSNDRITRHQISRIIFGDGDNKPIESELKFVESITLMPLKAMILDKLFFYDNKMTRMVVLDAALLFEAELDDICDKTLFVSAPIDLRVRRAGSRPVGKVLTRTELENREKLQISLSEKKGYCDLTILNDEDAEVTRRQVKKIWEDLI